ncbi:uncharacterized protein LOC106086041 [Stomoxys calcitrans]|uniref:uncharacterized protein LOC106086041 n=1 Tax=Stomoxys calcitrans TaxID=35570 RepID=UPI0027E2DECF|nr:uncharacterized protein LOC106086041 [Stomoxys calcitrans]
MRKSTTEDCWRLLLLMAVQVKYVQSFLHVSSQRGIFPNFHPVQLENDMYANFARHPCRRQCRAGASMTCYYKLYIHNYQMLGPECQQCLGNPNACADEHCIYGDGEPLPLQLVNYQFPGPAIEVCQNDVLIVDTYNNLTEDATLHWHGIIMKKTPWSDGVPYVTQYPIRPGDVYRVCFQVPLAGTHWYHSHVSLQRAMGVWGALIIRQSGRLDPHSHLFDVDDVDHALLLHDISSLTSPRNIVINGKGRNQDWPVDDARNHYFRMTVSPMRFYRIRIILNGVANCPVEISFDHHRFQVIATDGNDIEPVMADTLQMTSAERFDVIIYANNAPDTYWIRVRGIYECENITQYAILHYKGVPLTQLPEERPRRAKQQVVINALAQYVEKPEMVVITATNDNVNITNIPTVELKALEPMPCPANAVYRKFYTSFGYILENGVYHLQVGNITFSAPKTSMLQSRHLYNESEVYCNHTSLKEAGRDCRNSNCQCTHVIRVPANECIEMIVTNYMEETHPFHLHGYTFRVVGQGVFEDRADLYKVEEADRQGRLRRHSPHYKAVQKDTVQIPILGYIIIRFKSTNTGFWLLHCHIERHLLEGMAAVLKVGEDNEILSVTSANQCDVRALASNSGS